MDITLFTAPMTCAKVPLILLEEIGVPFETRLIRHMRREHKAPDFKRVNPKGKVPAILIDGQALTENVAIAIHLDALFPEAGLLPQTDALGRARQIADLCFCSSTLHPLVSRICAPQFMIDAAGVSSLQQRSIQAIGEYLQIFEDRLAEGPWWYGQTWSAMDPYLYWIFWRLGIGGDFDTSAYPRWTDHSARLEDRPAVRRALAREAADHAILAAEGLIPQRANAN